MLQTASVCCPVTPTTIITIRKSHIRLTDVRLEARMEIIEASSIVTRKVPLAPFGCSDDFEVEDKVATESWDQGSHYIYMSR
jgi:hypothetical protein